MKTLLMASTLAMLAAAPAFASSGADCKPVEGPRKAASEIAATVEAQGLKVREIEDEGGCYEVKAVDGEGKRLKMYVHPVTGEIVRTQRKD